MKDKLIKHHQERFNNDPAICVFAPGRVNFIGEHTDYNGGLVMPMALNQGIYLAVSKNDSDLLRINSIDFDKYDEFRIDEIRPDKEKAWANCPKGTVEMLLDKGHPITGMDLTITGDLPIGAGLSSSAAVEVAVGYAVNRLFELNIMDMDLALLCQEAEHAFTGTRCGIMDQMIAILGRKNKLLKLSCSDLKYEYIPFHLEESSLLIVNSNVSHNLAESEYNKRRQECEEILEIIKRNNGRMNSLSDYSLGALKKDRKLFTEVQWKRACHVISENIRVRETAEAFRFYNFNTVGKLLAESHESLKEDYEVSCKEVDYLVEKALSVSGVYGARMTGGGFGGCIIVLVRKEAIREYKTSLKAYQEKFNKKAEFYTAVPSDGVHFI